MNQPPAEHDHDHRSPLPVLNALLVCDEAIKEEGTGKITLVGIFETMRVDGRTLGAKSFTVIEEV